MQHKLSRGAHVAVQETRKLEPLLVHASSGEAVQMGQNWPIFALLPVENRPSCWWPVIWGGGWIVIISVTEA
eukprot:15366860-Ditylum_brightwellii.AAC.2